jgi:putative spermidine/putrescine transport system substrate-binding protein
MFKSHFFRCATVALAGIVVAALILFMSACGSSNSSTSSSSSAAASGPNAATATSVADFGGMDALVAAAQKEGTLNVIALPPDWANYGLIISAFEAKYKIKINSAQPDGNSQDEVNAITQLKGTDRAPDVVDIGANVTLANTALFAPYKVAGWNDIPADLKDPTGLWAADYTGYESIGYNATKLPAPTSVNDLLKPAYKGMVALNGNPTQASAGFNGVVMAALANGGTPDNIKAGVDFFAQLKKAGNLLPVDPTPATIAAGQTPVVIDWTYNNLAVTAEVKGKFDWKVVVPANDVVASYYDQAINKDAPHPAAARLWEEYLYSAEGSNFWLKGGAFPVLYDAMVKAGTVDAAAAAALPKVTGTPVTLTQDQLKTAQDYLLANWNKAVQ